MRVRLLCAAMLVSVACGPPDHDGDGYRADVDCNDAIHPDAPEVCNGIDDDCQGVVDEDSVDALTWYADFDSDGFGDRDAPTRACDRPAEYVADATDCHPNDTDAFPGSIPGNGSRNVRIADIDEDGWLDVLLGGMRDDEGTAADSHVYWSSALGPRPTNRTGLAGAGVQALAVGGIP